MSVITTQAATTNLIVGNKPSVLDAVIQIGRTDAPLLAAIGKGGKVSNVLHSWIVDNIPAPTMGNYVEISTPPAAPASTKQKTSNAVEIFQTTCGISYDQNATDSYGPKEWAYQRKLAMIRHALNQEYRILGLGRDNSAKVSVFMPYAERSSAVPGKMAGLFYYVTLGETTFVNGWRGHVMAVDSNKDWTGTTTAITVDMLDELVGKPYDSGAAVKTVWVGRNLKRSITKLFDRQWTNEKSANVDITRVELSTGAVDFKLHHMLTDKYGLGDVIIAGDPAFASYRPLAEIIKDLPENETAKKQLLYISATLEVKNATAFSILVGAK